MSFVELVPEPDNPYDANAVRVLLQGQKVGYVPKSDSLPISTYLQMGRGLYGAVSEIRREGAREQYELELWATSKNTDGDA